MSTRRISRTSQLKRRRRTIIYNIIDFLFKSNILLITVVTIGIIFLFMLFFGGNKAFASQETKNTDDLCYKYVKRVMIEPGDTLTDYALDYCKDTSSSKELSAYINEVIYMNHLFDDNLIAGNYIFLPYYSSEYVE